VKKDDKWIHKEKSVRENECLSSSSSLLIIIIIIISFFVSVRHFLSELNQCSNINKRKLLFHSHDP
jgi:hypothetical protein